MDGWQVIEQASELAGRGEPCALATVVWRQGPSSGQLGSRAIITASGELRGWIGGACAEPSVIRQARQVIAEGKPRLLLLGTSEQIASTPQLAGVPEGGGPAREGVMVVPISCQSEGALEVYIEPVVPAPHLVVVGRSPMSHTLADLARVLGWRADLIDWPDLSTADADERSMVVVATQGHGDEEAIERAVAARPAYLGLVGSARRGAAVLGYLAERGLDRELLDQVRVPAGLDLGRTSHAEIAVAILAELVQLRASGQLGASPAGAARASVTVQGADAGPDAAADQARPHARPEESRTTEPAEAVDPVCGMTVTAGPAGRPLEYEGSTYYFCCAGCRAEFESNPASYSRKETRC
jgi:xanthine dehydrogenase accessory factor